VQHRVGMLAAFTTPMTSGAGSSGTCTLSFEQLQQLWVVLMAGDQAGRSLCSGGFKALLRREHEE
jgi:hypothetical protein